MKLKYSITENFTHLPTQQSIAQNYQCVKYRQLFIEISQF